MKISFLNNLLFLIAKVNKMSLTEICTSYALKKLGKAALMTGLAAQVALPNMAFISSIAKPEYADKLYDYSTLPYALMGTAIGGLLYYFSSKARK